MRSKNERVELEMKIMKYRQLARQIVCDAETYERIAGLIAEIVHHSACEIQNALRYLTASPPPKSVFVATEWTVKITLNPKIDADIAPSAGLTRKSPTTPNPLRLTTLTLGGASGATAETKGENTGSLDFVFDSAKLLADRTLDCENEPFALHSLSKRIGIEDWLIHSVQAAAATHSKIDKPSFSADVWMKFSGSGGYNYMFPAGTNIAGLSGYYLLEETLNVNLSAKTPKVTIVATTLPPGGRGLSPNHGKMVTSTVTTIQDTRSDLQQIQQAIQNNRLSTPQ
jgi:hypothetical protein